MDRRSRSLTLSIVLTGDAPPNEFRIFTAGVVDTVKGKFTFDDVAATSVMAEYAAHGIDLMIDYDHASVAGLAVDPALAGKAAGWFNLAVRGGELWAVNVRWTPPAAEALARKEWRFMSPAFATDESGRITSVLNVALTNLPATRKLEPLMAASVTTLGGPMDPELIKKALDALVAGDSEAAAAILKDMIASAAGAAPEPEAPAEEMAERAPVEEEEEEQAAAVVAATSLLIRLTDKTTIASAVEEVQVWRASHLKLESETARLAKEREALEYAKRKENAITLTKLGAETPFTTGLSKGKLVKRLLDEPLDEQNERIKALLAARGGKLPTEIKPPPDGGGGGVQADGSKEFQTPDGLVSLSANELNECERAGAKPEVYAANKARRLKKGK